MLVNIQMSCVLQIGKRCIPLVRLFEYLMYQILPPLECNRIVMNHPVSLFFESRRILQEKRLEVKYYKQEVLERTTSPTFLTCLTKLIPDDGGSTHL
jgi:hypothetical protein